MMFVNDMCQWAGPDAPPPRRSEVRVTDHDVHHRIPATRLLDPQVIEAPADFYHQLLDEAPVWQVPGADLVVVSAFDAVAEAVKRHDRFSSNIQSLVYRGDDGAPALVPLAFDTSVQVLATADPPVHGAHRGAISPELVVRRVAELRPHVDALVDRFVPAPVGSGSFDFMGAVANPIPIRVVSRLIGFVDEDPDELLAAAFDTTAMLAGTQPLDTVLTAMARTADIMGWIGDEVDGAVAGGRQGILGLIAEAVRHGALDRDHGLVMLHTLLSAGGESTTSLLGSAAHVLATRPDLQAQVRGDRALLLPFIEEVVRLESPFRFHMRHVRSATELGGVDIRPGSTVLLLWAAANRDPRRYDRPDELLLDRRSPRDHVGFGRGLHFCLGAPLARLEAEAVLGRLLDATSWIEPGDAPPERENSLMVRRFSTLPLRAAA